MAPPAKRKKVDTEANPEGILTLSDVNVAMRLKQLEAENEKLKKQLVVVPQGVQDEVKYTVKDHAKFLTSIQKANAVKSLDLSALERKTQSFTTGSNPKWKPDAKLDAVTSTLLASNINIQELNLGDAQWASEEKYAKDLTKIVRHIKKSVTTVRCTSRLMAESVVGIKVKKPGRIWWCDSMGPVPHIPCTFTTVKVNILDALGTMQKLSKLKVVFNCVDAEKMAYGGELNPTVYKKKLFPQLKELEIHLTPEWAARHIGVGKPRDRVLEDLLQHWEGNVTFLDMNAVPKPAQEPAPFMAWLTKLLPGLWALRSIALRVEFLPMTGGMGRLETLGLLVDRAAPEALDAAMDFVTDNVVPGESLKQLKRVEVRAAPGYDKARLDAILAGLKESCVHLEGIKVNGWEWEQGQ